MGRRTSYPASLDSPSRQLFRDLVRDMEQIHIHHDELKKVKAYEQKSFYEKLDEIDEKKAAQHNAALDQVAAYQGQVFEEAQEALKDHQRAVEEEERRERLRKEEDARKERERVERERAEKLRREQEEAARLEAERKAKEAAAAEAEKARKAAEEEKTRLEREKLEEEKRRTEDAAKKAEQEDAQRKAEALEKTEAERQKRIGGGRLTQEEIKVHQRYVELHQHLKKFRQWLKDESKQNPVVKQNMGTFRRSIQKCVGQIRDTKGGNKNQLREIRVTLEQAAAIAEPSVDVRQFFAFPPDEIANAENTQVPALLVYCLNILSKCLIASLITEASVHPGHAEPIGIMAAQVFSSEEFIYRGHHMVDVLWAKYRVVCPAIWGFCGNEKTEAGRRALGWWRESPDGPFISEQTHADRMTALGGGYAALTLRNFGKTTRRNPFPNTQFWFAMHKILSIPPNEMQETHFLVLAAMLRSAPERVVGFFGHVGLALLRMAIIDLPKQFARQSMGINKLKLLKELYQREKNIII